jgi:cellulose synthase/poly-beta-1,6-N-acetylglucosamine synthase-like glycosyltransferase
MAIPVSVGICAYNEEKNIGNVLNLLHNTKVRGFKIIEILVVASGCTDRTCDIIKEWQKKDKRIKLIVERKRRGKIHALNKIIKRCRGKIFMNVDADQYFDKHALQSILNHLKDEGVGAVSANVIYLGGESIVEKTMNVMKKFNMEKQKYSAFEGFESFGVLYAFKRGICDLIPANVVNDDAYIATLCKIKGYKTVIEHQAKTYVKSPKILTDLINTRRRIIYGYISIRKNSHLKLTISLKKRILIVLRFLSKIDWKDLIYFLTWCFIEFYVNVLARLDMLIKENNPHIVWKVAKTTKNLNEFYPNYEKVK